MANARIIVRRRKSVRNIRKITRTMQLIATARFQAALARATATKPYNEKMAELVADLADAASTVSHPLMSVPAAQRAATVIITSNRGLCGSYNTNVLRLSIEHLDRLASSGVTSDVYMVGKKGINYFNFLRREMFERVTGLGDTPRFEAVEPLANVLMDRFTSGQISAVYVSHMRFYSAGQQRPLCVQLLPLSRDQQSAAKPAARKKEYEFSPSPQELLGELLPATVRARFFQAFTDAAVCEQIARMVAMKAATDAAGDMITMLTRQYNRARQTSITMELLDIIGGVNALG